MKPTLDTFLAEALHTRAWVKEAGFKTLYARNAERFIEGKRIRTIDLANAQARTPGKGCFTKLVQRLHDQYPDRCIYAECVLNPRLVGLLVDKLGFKVNPIETSSFYLPAKRR